MALYEEAKMMRSPMLFFVTNMKVGGSNLKEICLFSNMPFPDEYDDMIESFAPQKTLLFGQLVSK